MFTIQVAFVEYYEQTSTQKWVSEYGLTSRPSQYFGDNLSRQNVHTHTVMKQ